MSATTPVARHVFHPATSGTDRVMAWQEATGEPVFSWGRRSGQVDSYFFGPVKRKFRDWIESTKHAELTIYHDGMGADVLGPLDTCERKVFYLHSWFPRWEKNFEWLIRCTGRLMVTGDHRLDALVSRFAWIPGKYRLTAPEAGISDTLTGSGKGSGHKRRTGIWIHGKSWKSHGNRLRSIFDKWSPETGEIEVIAQGRAVPDWAGKDHIKWIKNLPLEFALMRLHTWDSTLLLNDFNLDAPWLFRALELGCFPLVPDGESIAHGGLWKEDFAPKPYDWGNFGSAIEILEKWRNCDDQDRSSYQEWVDQMRDFRGDREAFAMQWKGAKEMVVNHRSPNLRKRRPVADLFPVGLYENIQRMRASY